MSSEGVDNKNLEEILSGIIETLEENDEMYEIAFLLRDVNKSEVKRSRLDRALNMKGGNFLIFISLSGEDDAQDKIATIDGLLHELLKCDNNDQAQMDEICTKIAENL